MAIDRVDVYLLSLPLVEPFVAAHGTTAVRELAVVRVNAGHRQGWGECSALPEPTYTDEYAAGAFTVLAEELAPRLVGFEASAASAGRRLAAVPGQPMAKAALEMALLDLELREAGQALADRLGMAAPASRSGPATQVGTVPAGAAADLVPAGAAVGLGAPEAVVARAVELAQSGFARVKVKIQPGHDREVVAAIDQAQPDLEVQVDANGSYPAADLDRLVALADLGVTAIEQPFAPDDVGSAAKLVARLAAGPEVAVVADEAAPDLDAIERLWSAGALTGVSIKPARLGGLGAAMAVHDWCVAHQVAATAGGMVECGLGRHALAALAGQPGFTLTGDLSPAGRWLAADPWPDLVLVDGGIQVPAGVGVAPRPDLTVLDAHTIDHHCVRS